MKPKEKRGFDVFIGILIGIIGNLFVSSLFEFSKVMWEKMYEVGFNAVVLSYWAFLFVIASILLFQSLRVILREYGLASKTVVQILHIGTIGCAVIGIYAIILNSV